MSTPDHTAVPPAPLVSVSITAFNSERWLARAIESALRQRTNFPIEILVADDSSTDGTIAVARSYQEREPQVIRVLDRTKNVGMQRNYYETFEQCRGKYIAWLDADDYWTDPEKLTYQVEVMESDPSVSVSGHYSRSVTPEGKVWRERFPSVAPGRYGISEIIRHNFLPSPSIMFRNGIQRNLPKWYFDLPGLVDWPILLMAALSGDIVLLDRTMADYMLTPNSAYMSRGSLYQDGVDLKFYEYMESTLPQKWHRQIRAARGKRHESMAYTLRKQRDFAGAHAAAFKALRSPDLVDNCGSKIKSLLLALIGPLV